MIGATLTVKIRTNGQGRIEKAPASRRTITALYLTPGKVRDNVGDVWYVRPAGNGNYLAVR